MGLLFFIPFLLLNFTIIDSFFNNERYKDPLILSLFTAFLFMTIAALFNVVLESPLYSGTYWIICGMLYQRHIDLDIGERLTPGDLFNYSQVIEISGVS